MISELLADVEAIDVKVGLQYCMEDEEFYQDMLKEYCASDKTQEMITYYETKNWKDYQIIVHGVKGISLTIGAAGLSEHMKGLEMATKASDFDYIDQNHSQVLEEYKSLLKLLEAKLA